jgi:beta-N-acetylhexosaminidase
VIRGEIGFDGLLMSDDLSMQALTGSLDHRAKASLFAGCDVVLHCNGNLAEMCEIATELKPLEDIHLKRADAALAHLSRPEEFDIQAAEARVTALLGTVS